MGREFISGVKEVEKALKGMAEKSADKVAKAAINAEMDVLKKNIRKAAPVGPTGNLKKAIGSRLNKSKRANIVTAKAGLNVGKKDKKTGRIYGPHAHLVALGTLPRFRKKLGGKFGYITTPTKKQLSTGTMPENHFVRDATGRSFAQMKTAAIKRAKRAIEREVRKAAKRTRSN